MVQRERPRHRLQVQDLLCRVNRTLEEQQEIDVAPLPRIPSRIGAVEQQIAEPGAIQLPEPLPELGDDVHEVRRQPVHDPSILLLPSPAPAFEQE